MTPPQVSPTAKASSSLYPNRIRTVRPSWSAWTHRSYTVPSTQPPETEPMAVP